MSRDLPSSPEPEPKPKPGPPQAERRPQSRERFGDRTVDEYAWLRERDDPAVRAHLEAERDFAEARLSARTGELRERLYTELRDRIREDDRSVPARHGPYVYSSRTELGDEYPRHARCALVDGQAGPEQVYLDENQLAGDSEYFDLAALAISPDHNLCAYAVDRSGDEIYTIAIKDLRSGSLLPERIEGCGHGLAWGDDGHLFYDRLDEAHRPWQIWRHRLGRPVAEDLCVWQEDDPRFHLSVARTRSDDFVIISADSQISSQAWLIPCQAPSAAPWPVSERVQGIEYGVVHHRGPGEARGGGRLLMLTNEGAQNFELRVAELPAAGWTVAPPKPGALRWRELLGHRDDVLLEGVEAFAERLIVWERRGGLEHLRIVPGWPCPAGLAAEFGPGEHEVAFDDPTYALGGGSNDEFDAAHYRFAYSSLTTPRSVYDYDPLARTRTLRKRREVVGGHDPRRYASARLWATAGDGERVPISLVWRCDGDRTSDGPGPSDGPGSRDRQARPDGPRPLVLYAYGAYGLSSDASFSSARLSLLDRGAIWAIAHVRGGGELGRRWYEAGKLAAKPNSFTDYIACAEHLIAEGWTTPDQLAGTGGSAGGLLIAAVANLRPELFTALVADVPFVDVLNTMLDPSLPLTAVEWEEWGNPEQAEAYATIRSYSPYDNVRAQAYPNLLVIAGWNDPRVGYWEPAKWVARLRERKTDDREVLLWTNMEAGHGGASGRFAYLREVALEYAFLIDRLGLAHELPR